jgi:glutamate racemase
VHASYHIAGMEADRQKGCIGVFDSGLGGLTVVRRLMTELPAEDIVYLGDSARVPYGTKSPQTIRAFAAQDAAFLMRFDPKLIVVACNTASAHAMETLSASLPVDVLGVVEPGARLAVAFAGSGPIGVMATEATIASGAYTQVLQRLRPGVSVLSAACPLLVPIVEEGRGEDDPIVLAVLTDYLRQMQRQRPSVLIMGCTHYPLLSGAIGKLMGPATRLIDSGWAAAMAVQRLLTQKGLARQSPLPGTLRCFATDNPERLAQLAQRFLGHPVDVQWVGTDELTCEVVR